MFMNSPGDGHLCHFDLLAIATGASVNIDVQTWVQVPAFNSFVLIPGDGIAGSNGRSLFNFGDPPMPFL